MLFLARLDTGSLLSVLTDMEPWAASVQNLPARPRDALAGMMDPSVARDAGRRGAAAGRVTSATMSLTA